MTEPESDDSPTAWAIRAVQAQALRDAAAELDRQADAPVEVALTGIDWVIAWLNDRADRMDSR